MTSHDLKPEIVPDVGIDFMNRTHHEEVGIVNTLISMVKARLSGGQNDAEISEKLMYWLEHTQAHFDRENKLMMDTSFPAFSVHSKEHETALTLMETVITSWQENRDIERLQDYVFNLWPNWFVTHVSTMDTVTAEFALMSGYSEEIVS